LSSYQEDTYGERIAGIYDEHLENQMRDQHIPIDADLVHQAGLAATRKMYQIIHDHRYSAVIIGGGARHIRHFTEMVGGDQVVTINWKGTADVLLEQEAVVCLDLLTCKFQRAFAVYLAVQNLRERFDFAEVIGNFAFQRHLVFSRWKVCGFSP
jgi:hypothetical protein